MLKILSYNIFGVKEAGLSGVPDWATRQKNLKKNINTILNENEIDVICLQEVNENNMKLIEDVAEEFNFEVLEKYPMFTEMGILQYNLNLISRRGVEDISGVCINHNNLVNFQYDPNPFMQEMSVKADEEASDYRTTVINIVEKNNCQYLIANIHTDHCSSDLKKRGIERTLEFIQENVDMNEFLGTQIVVGDMNTVVHLDHVRTVLNKFPRWTTLSKGENFNYLYDHSYHGYGKEESVHVDFAFVPKEHLNKCEYELIKQSDLGNEGSDHRPVIYTID